MFRRATEQLDVRPPVLVLAVSRMAEAVGNSFLIIVLPLFIASEFITGGGFGLAEVTITGIVLALFGLVNSALQPVTGSLSDRLGRRKIFVLLGLIVLGSASAAYAFATTYTHLLGLRVLQGVAGAFIVPASLALVNDYASDADRGGNLGVFNAFRVLGFGIGPVGAGIVLAAGPYHLGTAGRTLEVSGFDAAFVFAGVMAFVGFGLVWWLVDDPEVPRRNTDSGPRKLTGFTPTGYPVLSPVFALGAVSFLTAISIALFATLGDLVNTRLDQGARMFGLQFAAFVFAHVLLQAPIGKATDRYGRTGFLLVGAVLLIPTTVVQGFILDPWLMFAARFAQGAAAAVVFTAALALAGDLAPADASGSTLAVLTMGFGFGIAVGPLLSGFLVAYGFAVPFIAGGILASLSVALITTHIPSPTTVSPQQASATWYSVNRENDDDTPNQF